VVRAVVLGAEGEPALVEIAEPEGPGEPVRILACGLCGSDVEKLGSARVGTVLGHEVVARTTEGTRVALVHHAECGRCERCRAGHESTCEQFAQATIVPGGFAEHARASGWVELPAGVDDALGTYAEPLACVLRGAERVPRGRVLVVGHGFVGRLFAEVLRRRGDDVFSVDVRADRAGRTPDGLVDAAVVCARGGAADALAAVAPGGNVLLFADAGRLPVGEIYRRELTVAGSRSATRAHLAQAVSLLPLLELPPPTVLPLEHFGEGLARYRSGDVLKIVFVP
jgi:L-iditol 2-dehydrogenase